MRNFGVKFRKRWYEERDRKKAEENARRKGRGEAVRREEVGRAAPRGECALVGRCQRVPVFFGRYLRKNQSLATGKSSVPPQRELRLSASGGSARIYLTRGGTGGSPREPLRQKPRAATYPTPTRTMSRPVTMNDLLHPEGCESTDDKTAKLRPSAGSSERAAAGAHRQGCRAGRVRRQEVYQALTHGHEVPAAVRSEGLQIRRPQGGEGTERNRRNGWARSTISCAARRSRLSPNAGPGPNPARMTTDAQSLRPQTATPREKTREDVPRCPGPLLGRRTATGIFYHQLEDARERRSCGGGERGSARRPGPD